MAGKYWWESGWWSVAGVVIGAPAAALTILGLLFPTAFSALGSQMTKDPTAFSLGTAWVAILAVTGTDGVLAWALWNSVKEVRSTRSAALPSPVALRPAHMIFGEVLDGKYVKNVRHLALDIVIQNPGDLALVVQGLRTVTVEFGGTQAEVVWSVEAPPVEIPSRLAGRLKVVGTFSPNVTHTLTGRQSVVLRGVYLRGAFHGGTTQEVSVHAGSGNSIIGGSITVVAE